LSFKQLASQPTRGSEGVGKLSSNLGLDPIDLGRKLNRASIALGPIGDEAG
jgi:hypothetical protein